MKRILIVSALYLVLMPPSTSLALPIYVDGDHSNDTIPVPVSKEKEVNHNWKKMSSDVKVVEGDSHEYTVRHNFVVRKRTCDVTHKVRTDVWYCDIHDHTKSEVALEETIHSRKHKQ